jgi:hypothetical protein
MALVLAPLAVVTRRVDHQLKYLRTDTEHRPARTVIPSQLSNDPIQVTLNLAARPVAPDRHLTRAGRLKPHIHRLATMPANHVPISSDNGLGPSHVIHPFASVGPRDRIS